MTVATPTLAHPGPVKRLFTVREFEQMAEAGIIRGRYELVHGEVIEMPPVGNAHSIALQDLYDALRPAWPHPKFIRTQATQRFDEYWAPMPDLALLTRRPIPGAQIDELPVLVVEVSDETLSYDLGAKRMDYARAEVPEYWVVDVKRRRIRAFRRPDAAAVDAEHAYLDEIVADVGGTISPLAIPTLQINVADVLPAAGA